MLPQKINSGVWGRSDMRETDQCCGGCLCASMILEPVQGQAAPGYAPYPPMPLPTAGRHCRGTWAAHCASKDRLCCPIFLAFNLWRHTELLGCSLTIHKPRYGAGCSFVWDVEWLQRQRRVWRRGTAEGWASCKVNFFGLGCRWILHGCSLHQLGNQFAFFFQIKLEITKAWHMLQSVPGGISAVCTNPNNCICKESCSVRIVTIASHTHQPPDWKKPQQMSCL